MGCAGKARAVAVQADATVYNVLAAVQDGADTLERDGAITSAQRQAIAPALLKALKLGDAYNRAVRAHSPFEALPALMQALEALRADLLALLPRVLPVNLVGLVNQAIGLLPAGAGAGGV
ncbi:MAG: hypothetical protein AB7H88_09290 [Vicinamibacterales bacterium]